jgi:uncharacterized protein involved in exopolysaccharide biosynthesis
MPNDIHPPHHRSAFRLARALWGRRKWLALLAFAAPFAACVSLIMAMPDFFRASATVLVKQEQVSESMARSFAATSELEPRLQTISQEILSRARLLELINRYDLYPTLREKAAPEVVVERMRKDIRLEQRKEVDQRWGRSVTVAFTLSYQGWEPRTVAQVVNTLAALYVEENEKMRGNLAAGAQSVGAVDNLTRLKRELAELRTRFSDKYPDVIRLKAEIAVLERERAQMERARAGTAPVQAQTPDFNTMERELDALGKKEQHLQETIAATPPRGGSTLRREQELERLRRDQAATTELRVALQQRHEQARLAQDLRPDRGEQFRILDPALAPNEPVAPSRLRLILMALILSLGMAGVVMLLAEQLDTSFHRLDELWGYTSLSVLASVPRIVTRADTWRGWLRFGVLSVVAVAGLTLLVQVAYSLGERSEQLVWMLAQRGGS